MECTGIKIRPYLPNKIAFVMLCSAGVVYDLWRTQDARYIAARLVELADQIDRGEYSDPDPVKQDESVSKKKPKQITDE